MKKIKIISSEGIGSLQKNIDKWIDEIHPYIESVSAVTHNPSNYTAVYIVSILYSEEVSLGGE
jgi:hypothetical protein